MLRNNMAYLGLLSFLGLLGLVTGNEGFYVFFGFFGFFSALLGKGTDERIDRNVNRACRNSFVFCTGASAFFIAALRAIEAFPAALAIVFAGNMIVFVASFIYFNERGD
jgi:hypothetical protein